MSEMLGFIKTVLELGSPAVYLIILITLWREYRRIIDILIEVIKKRDNHPPAD